MKKILFIAFAIPFVMVSCKKDPAGAIVGTWDIVELTGESITWFGGDLSSPLQMEQFHSVSCSGYIQFDQSGVVKLFSENDRFATMDYSYNPSIHKLSFSGDKLTTSVIYTTFQQDKDSKVRTLDWGLRDGQTYDVEVNKNEMKIIGTFGSGPYYYLNNSTVILKKKR